MNIIKKLIEFFESKKKLSFLFLIITLGTMIYFSSIPGGTISVGSIWPSIIYHFTIFAGFAFFFLAFITNKKLDKKTIFTALLVSLIVAILDEIHQLFVPLRSATIQDVLTDMTGASLCIVLYWLIKKSK